MYFECPFSNINTPYFEILLHINFGKDTAYTSSKVNYDNIAYEYLLVLIVT